MVSNSLHGRYWHACKHLRTAHQAVVELWKVWYKQKNALDCIALRNSFYFASKYSSVSVWSTLCSSTMAAVCRAVGIYHANYKELWESGSFQRCFFFFFFFWCSALFTQFYPSLPSIIQQLLANQSANTLYSLMTRGCQGVSSQSLGFCDQGLPLANTLIGYSSLIN